MSLDRKKIPHRVFCAVLARGGAVSLAFAVASSCLFAQTLVAVAKIFAVAFLGFDGIVVCGLCLASGEIAFLVGAGVELLCGALVAAGGEA